MRVSYGRQAELDLEDIVEFGAERWGVAQADAYVSQLVDAAERLADHPRIGSPADELVAGLRHLSVGRHVIYYLVGEHEVIIARILHMSRNARHHLP